MQNKNPLDAFERLFRVQFYILVNQFFQPHLQNCVQSFILFFAVKACLLGGNSYPFGC